MRILLDTHAALWASFAVERLGESIGGALRRPDRQILFSDASVLAMVLKEPTGKLRMEGGVAAFVAERTKPGGYARLPVDTRHILPILDLPRVRRDPFDRLLVAQCVEEDLVLATVDAAIRRYPIRTIR